MVLDHLFYAHLYKDLPHASMSRQVCEEHYESVESAGMHHRPSEITKAPSCSREALMRKSSGATPALSDHSPPHRQRPLRRADFVAFYHWVVFGGEEAARGEPAAVETVRSVSFCYAT